MDQNKQLDWLKHLVKIRSVVESEGENTMIETLREFCLSLEYFKKHPDRLTIIEVPQDAHRRKSLVAAMIVDVKLPTIIGIGHIDTVSTQDYGTFESIATECDQLKEAFLNNTSLFRSEVVEDLNNEDYLFGRGSLDMKAGVAAWTLVLEAMDQNPNQVIANCIVGFVCDEEGNSKGMQSILHALVQLRQDESLEYLGVIDTDYTTVKPHDKTSSTLYSGTIGKFLLNVLVFGKEAHASDPLQGLDATMILSAMVQKICYNLELSETSLKKQSPVIVPLHIEDAQTAYSVQTAKMAWSYFNVCYYQRPIEEWMNLFVQQAQEVADELSQQMQHLYDQLNLNKPPIHIRVITSQDLDLQSHQNLIHPDERIEARNQVKHAYQQQMHDEAAIILYISLPYYPSCSLDPKTSKLVGFIENRMKSEFPYTIEPYYPYISDMSFVSKADPSDLMMIRKSIPNSNRIDEQLYQLMDQLDCEMMNLGPRGHDAHQWTERVSIQSYHWLIKTLKQCFLEVEYENSI